MLHGKLVYNNKRLVISSKKRQQIIISNIHKDDPNAKAVVSRYL